MIDLTHRLTQCRSRTTFQILRYAFQAGCHTVEVRNTVTGMTYQWSANPNHPDSARAWDRFVDAFNAAVGVLPPMPAPRTDIYLDLITSPATGRSWENFFWTPPRAPSAPDPVDNITDLFG